GIGNDTIELSGNGTNLVNTGEGDDIIGVRDVGVSSKVLAGRGQDKVSGGNEDDDQDGGKGNDILEGGDGQDTQKGGKGDDIADSGDGDDIAEGNRGQDTLLGGAGNDTIFGGKGFDSIDGGEGNDYIDGGRGNDTVTGGTGNDTVFLSADNDLITGGEGTDVFEVSILSFGKVNNINDLGVDTLTDFSSVDDIIRLDSQIFTQLGDPGKLDPDELIEIASFDPANISKDLNANLVYDSASGSIYYVAQNSQATKIIELSNKPFLSPDDFEII
ncbi:MAG: calcium-binding protein, partial [Microcoleaceae cyanobacterium]